jgi:hypothetical protein
MKRRTTAKTAITIPIIAPSLNFLEFEEEAASLVGLMDDVLS